MKPMLAASTDGDNLSYPLIVSPKLDGVRALIIDGVVVSRSLKPIPNKHVQELFGHKNLNGLDGELVVCDSSIKMVADTFQQTTSGVMSIEGKPRVLFFVFDDFTSLADPFKVRLVRSAQRAAAHRYCEVVKHFVVRTKAELLSYEEKFLEKGFEGLMARDPDGQYKCGRSTLKQQWLVKLKRFTDAEAVITGTYPLQHNSNEAVTNLLGYKERSTKQEGKVARQLLGGLHVRDLTTGIEFDVGTGFTEPQRSEYWQAREKLVGGIIKYKFQAAGAKEKPRFPVFLGFRDGADL